MEWQRRYLDITRKCAAKAETFARLGSGPLHCIVRDAPGDGTWGALDVLQPGQKPPEGWRLLSPGPFPSHRPYSTWADWIRALQPPVIGA